MNTLMEPEEEGEAVEEAVARSREIKVDHIKDSMEKEEEAEEVVEVLIEINLDLSKALRGSKEARILIVSEEEAVVDTVEDVVGSVEVVGDEVVERELLNSTMTDNNKLLLQQNKHPYLFLNNNQILLTPINVLSSLMTLAREVEEEEVVEVVEVVDDSTGNDMNHLFMIPLFNLLLKKVARDLRAQLSTEAVGERDNLSVILAPEDRSMVNINDLEVVEETGGNLEPNLKSLSNEQERKLNP